MRFFILFLSLKCFLMIATVLPCEKFVLPVDRWLSFVDLFRQEPLDIGRQVLFDRLLLNLSEIEAVATSTSRMEVYKKVYWHLSESQLFSIYNDVKKQSVLPLFLKNSCIPVQQNIVSEKPNLTIIKNLLYDLKKMLLACEKRSFEVQEDLTILDSVDLDVFAQALKNKQKKDAEGEETNLISEIIKLKPPLPASVFSVKKRPEKKFYKKAQSLL